MEVRKQLKRYIWEVKPASKLFIENAKSQTQKNETINIMEKARATYNFCKILENQKGIKIRFAFISLIDKQWRMIDYNPKNF